MASGSSDSCATRRRALGAPGVLHSVAGKHALSDFPFFCSPVFDSLTELPESPDRCEGGAQHAFCEGFAESLPVGMESCHIGDDIRLDVEGFFWE